MLTLTRREDEVIVLRDAAGAEMARIMVTRIGRDRVRVGITADPSRIIIERAEAPHQGRKRLAEIAGGGRG